MRQRLFVAISLAGLLVGGTALAQDEGGSGDEGEFDNITEPESTPPAEATPAPPPVETHAEADGAGGTDHDLIVGDWGAELVTTMSLPGLTVPTPASIPMLGVRKWSSRDSGWEAGAALAFTSDGGDPAQTTLWIGGSFGLLKTLGVFDHMTVFWEPQGSLLIVIPNDGIDATNDDTLLILDGRLAVGSEIQLGMIGLSQLALTTRLSAGLQVTSYGNTSFFIGTEGGEANWFNGLLEADVGFVMYW